MKTTAAVVFEPGGRFEVVELDLDGPLAGEVLVEIVATGVCHSDASFRDDPACPVPIVLGHEGAGIVRAIGDGVTGFVEGDHVIPVYTPYCGRCDLCRSGRTNLCRAYDPADGGVVMPDGTTRFWLDGRPVHHAVWCSTFSQFTVVPEIALVKVPPDLPLDPGCLLGCGVPTGAGAVLFEARPEPGGSVAVFGLGGVGLNAIQGARLAGAGTIIGIDLNPAKEAPARQFGATDFVLAGDADVVGAIRGLTGGVGVDVAVEATGVPAVGADAVASTRVGWGTTVMISVPEPGATVPIDVWSLIEGRTVKGTGYGGTRHSDLAAFVNWYQRGDLLIDELVTHRLPITEINQAFDLMANGESVRTIISF